MIALNKTNEALYRMISYVITVFILLGMAVFIYFLYFVNDDIAIRTVGTVAALMLVVTWVMSKFRQRKPVQMEETPVRKFVLVTRDGEREKEWSCEGSNSFLIGKSSSKQGVDIELGDTHYSEYISNEHAVLNYSNMYWYIEDLSSFNGVGLKKKGEEYALRLKPMTSYKIEVGDLIYISKAKILVR